MGLNTPDFGHRAELSMNCCRSSVDCVLGRNKNGSPFNGSTTVVVASVVAHLPLTKFSHRPGLSPDNVHGFTVDQDGIEAGAFGKTSPCCGQHSGGKGSATVVATVRRGINKLRRLGVLDIKRERAIIFLMFILVSIF